jgi:hypothetical protein
LAEYGKSQAVSQSKDTSEEKHSNRISETEESRTQESGTSSIKTSTNIASKGKAINLWGGGGGGGGGIGCRMLSLLLSLSKDVIT